ncbi:BCCT family transporter [Pseudohoeflea coraliihabitans]|uniref:BCCT family transporter n=1 Tax=Pseudohoeflea coraliihabitans TaxID=2860393 RepID=A0ABS6WPH5_9HYPH|nr:BCCT family transporter [Pseudohoeflea sp. DP4N28-3]MBW3096990.1 BCCT family transporter [Pseudohoeflea sp. DP4N28-3]
MANEPITEPATSLEVDTDFEAGQDNVQVLGLDIHNPVFFISAVVIVAFVILTLMFGQTATDFFAWLRPAMTNTFDWPLLLAGNLFVLFALLLVVTPLGSIRLGGIDARPDFGYLAWFSMLFAAGMGIGLMFFGVSEPLSHYASSIGGVVVENGARTDWAPLAGAAGDAEAARLNAMAATIFHWGAHPWAIYAVVGLALAFFSYNRGLPLTLRSAFYPLLGERIWGWPGHIIDTLAVFATLFGLATSLGFGAEQALSGLNFLFGVPITGTAKVVLILFITAIALGSVVAGLDAGVKRLSELNMILALLLLGFIFIAGPTAVIATGILDNTVAYVKEILPLSNPFGREDTNFMQGWTAFYWAWWISWSPFVGMFIARVSRGRTVREFITCVLIVPTVVSIIWMSTFGGSAINQVIAQGNEAVKDAPQAVMLFEMLRAYPMTQIASFIGIVLVMVFFVTSSDSGSLVIDTITAGGIPNPPVAQRVFWATFEGVVAIVLLIGGGLGALQAAAVTTGVPFALLLVIMIWSVYKGLSEEHRFLKNN